ncbi:MAG: metalloregulator ArsR/SmtB family transcription factor [Phycisphaerae bacterium]
MLRKGIQPERLLAWMDALSDPTRLRLLRLLERQELGVAEICEVLGIPQSTVSRHLKTLSDQGWVVSRRRGTAHLYAMVLDELDEPARDLWVLARDQTAGWATLQQDQLRLDRLMETRRGDPKAFFAGMADRWEAVRAEHFGHSFLAAAFAAMLPPDAVVADLGCGTGNGISALAPAVAQVIGVDQSGEMLETAHKRLKNFKNVKLYEADLHTLPLPDAAVDAALCSLSLSYVPDFGAVVRELARVLKPGGRAVVTDLLRHDRDDLRRDLGQSRMGFEPPEIEKAMKAAGLTAVKLRPIPPDPGATGPALFVASGLKR